jgi:hypothetical protein
MKSPFRFFLAGASTIGFSPFSARDVIFEIEPTELPMVYKDVP